MTYPDIGRRPNDEENGHMELGANNYEEPLLGREGNPNDSAEIGQRMNFAEIRQRQIYNEVASLKKDICTDLLFDVLILMMVIHFGATADCGIPIFKWCVLYFIILGIRSLLNLVKIYIVRTFSP